MCISSHFSPAKSIIEERPERRLLSDLFPVLLSPVFPSRNFPCLPKSILMNFIVGAGLSNYPVQVGRPFKVGEIQGFPQARLAGSAVATQADVKQRWGDGSVRHAIISFIIPSLAPNATVLYAGSGQKPDSFSHFGRHNVIFANAFPPQCNIPKSRYCRWRITSFVPE